MTTDTPVAIVDAFGHGLSRALATAPPMLPFLGDSQPPEFLEHFAVNLVSNVWTPLLVFAGWSAFLAYRQRAIRAAGTDAEVQSASVIDFLSRTGGSPEAPASPQQAASVDGDEASADGQTVPPMCRICMDGVDEEETLGALISPCLCRGSMQYVHRGCLNRWRVASANARSTTHCDNCQYRYRLETEWRPGHVLRSAFVLLLASGLSVAVLVLLTSHVLQLLDRGLLQFTPFSMRGWMVDGTLSAGHVAALFEMQEAELMIVDARWGVSYALGLVQLEGLYLVVCFFSLFLRFSMGKCRNCPFFPAF